MCLHLYGGAPREGVECCLWQGCDEERTKVTFMKQGKRCVPSIGVRAGGAGGAAAPPKFWATQIFGAAKEIWAKPVLKEVSVFLFFEEIDIFYFNLKSAW